MNNEQIRAAFEAWFVQHQGSRSRWLLDKVTEGPWAGDYRDGVTQGAWSVWQAACVFASSAT